MPFLLLLFFFRILQLGISDSIQNLFGFLVISNHRFQSLPQSIQLITDGWVLLSSEYFRRRWRDMTVRNQMRRRQSFTYLNPIRSLKDLLPVWTLPNRDKLVSLVCVELPHQRFVPIEKSLAPNTERAVVMSPQLAI